MEEFVILVDENDLETGMMEKMQAHVEAHLHRAFSVFIFNKAGLLMLQQRAFSKYHSPGLWTNTCCSHPLYGYSPTEVDTPEAVEAGTVPGTKRAAVRKLLHELGIQPESVPADRFSF